DGCSQLRMGDGALSYSLYRLFIAPSARSRRGCRADRLAPRSWLSRRSVYEGESLRHDFDHTVFDTSEVRDSDWLRRPVQDCPGAEVSRPRHLSAEPSSP